MNNLPHVIKGYIEAANAQAPQRVAACFTPDATVADERTLHRGRDEIEAWAHETGARYQAIIEPIHLREAAGRHRLQAKVRGNFPGSPITLRFDFRLVSAGIESLEIGP
jgi:nuclear transport factor 2 (NTF2) superfamily protein